METILRMTFLDWFIFLASIFAYIPLIVGVVRDRFDKSQVMTTWLMYFLLDCITFLSTNKEGVTSALLLGFAVGSFIMFSILLYQKRCSWGKLETLTITLFVICLSVWSLSGPYWTVITGILSEVVVGVYLAIKTWKNPKVEYNLFGYSVFFFASILAMFDAKDWSIPEMGYPLCETMICFFTLLPLVRKARKERDQLLIKTIFRKNLIED